MVTPAMPLPQPGPAVRRGTSKAVPVVVSAGLGVGVFFGLVLGIGGGTSAPAGAPPVAAVTIDAGVPDAAPAVAAVVVDAAPPPVVIDAAVPDAGPPPVPVATLTFEVVPAGADIRLTVDGEAVDGTTSQLELPDGKRTVRVVGRASGYRTFDKKITVRGDQVVDVRLVKRRASSGGDDGPGLMDPGLIDL
ncbi:MAG: PEGA domain-containing protein [Kofleriaceae bacterium]